MGDQMQQVSLRAQERLQDGSVDPDGVIPENHIKILLSGFQPNENLTLRLEQGQQSAELPIQVNGSGDFDLVYEAQDPLTLATLPVMGSVEWVGDGPYKATIDDIEVTLGPSA